MVPIEHFSANLEAASSQGTTAMIGFGLLFAGFVLAALFFYAPGRIGALPRGLRLVLSVLISLGPVTAYLSLAQRATWGTASALWLEERDGERLVTAYFSTVRPRAPDLETMHVFTVAGAHLGGASWKGARTLGTVGGALVVDRGGELELVDRRSRKTVVKVHESLVRAFGKGQFELQGMEGDRVRLLLKDGRREVFELVSMLPEPLRAAVPTALWLNSPDRCGTDPQRYRDGHKGHLKALERRAKLLRPRFIHAPQTSSLATACTYPLAKPAILAIHRSTAFGEDGAFLLSALPVDAPEAALWTTDLTPAIGPEPLREVRVFHPELRGESLCFWLLRERRSLSEVCLAAADGALRSAQVVF